MRKIVWLGALVSVALVATAFAQSGSTGGTVGNDDKAISGTRQESPPATRQESRSSSSDDDDNPCVVADPTGTPLNIRTSPNGRIVGSISNGHRVRITDQTTQDGKQWAYIAGTRPKGWVFRRFLSCR